MTYNDIHKTEVENIVLLSDVHIGARNASLEWLDNMKNYFTNFFIPYLKTVVQDNADKTALIIAGDFFDHRQHIDINVLNVGLDIMIQLSSVVQTYIVIGNHDIYKKRDVDVNSLRVFRALPNVKVIDTLTLLNVKSGVKFALIPWIENHEEETNLLKELKTMSDYAIMHADISGMIYDNGRAILNGADSKVYGKKIYSGHIHKRQEGKNVTYIGSPYQLKLSDIYNVKGVYTLHVNDDGTVKESFVENKYSPIFLKVAFANILNKTLGELKSMMHNNYVYIVIPKKVSKELNKPVLMNALEECGAKHLEIIIDKDKDNTVVQENAVSDMSINDIFLNKINAMTDLGETERKDLINMNNMYMKQASEELSNAGVII